MNTFILNTSICNSVDSTPLKTVCVHRIHNQHKHFDADSAINVYIKCGRKKNRVHLCMPTTVKFQRQDRLYVASHTKRCLLLRSQKALLKWDHQFEHFFRNKLNVWSKSMRAIYAYVCDRRTNILFLTDIFKWSY